jgi:Flp pilus assembly pilin Flp
MRALSDLLRCCWREEGATVIEYAFIGVLISIAAVTAFNTIGTHLSTTFATVAASF